MPVVGSVMESFGSLEGVDCFWQAEADKTPKARKSRRIRKEKKAIGILHHQRSLLERRIGSSSAAIFRSGANKAGFVDEETARATLSEGFGTGGHNVFRSMARSVGNGWSDSKIITAFGSGSENGVDLVGTRSPKFRKRNGEPLFAVTFGEAALRGGDSSKGAYSR